jgi:hypothetical protein
MAHKTQRLLSSFLPAVFLPTLVSINEATFAQIEIDLSDAGER